MNSWINGSSRADYVWYLNERLFAATGKISKKKAEDKHYIVPLGMNIVADRAGKGERGNNIGFMGILKRDQGLELLFDAMDDLIKTIPSLRVEIIGAGPDEEYFKNLTKQKRYEQHVFFHGYIADKNEMAEIISSWKVAVALYVPHKDNVSVYADPSKVKVYLECAVPVIMTDVPQIAKEIQERGAGVVVDYDKNALAAAVTKIFTAPAQYQRNCVRIASLYNYVSVYNDAFRKIFGPDEWKGLQ